MTECYKWWLPKFFLLLPFVSVFSVVSQCCWAPVDCLGSQCWMSQPRSLFAELPRQQNRPGEGLEEDVLWHSRDVWHWSGWCLGWGAAELGQLGGWQWEGMAWAELWDTAVPPAALLVEPAHHGGWELLCLQLNFQLFALWREMEPGLSSPAEPCALRGCGACLSAPLEPPRRSSSASTLGLKAFLPSCQRGSIQHQTRICEDCRHFSGVHLPRKLPQRADSKTPGLPCQGLVTFPINAGN